MTETTDHKTLATLTEELLQRMMKPDETSLNTILASNVSYGHSDGKLETREQLVGHLLSGRYQFVKISFDDVTIQLSGDTALVRHKLRGDTNDNNTPGRINLGVLLVWQKLENRWQIVARQSFKLPQ
jgi:hypothetical protein